MTDKKLDSQSPRIEVKSAKTALDVANPPRVLVDTETLRSWIANCDPYTPIDPGDERYFDFGSKPDLRGRDHMEGLFDAITLSSEDSCQLFSGFSGTGKSTELRRLKHRLEEAGYTVLLVDTRDYHNLNHPLAIEDLMVIVAGAFGDATARLLVEDVSFESYWSRFKERLNKDDVKIEGFKLGIGIADIKGVLKHAKPFWLKIRDVLSGSPQELRQDSHDYIRSCVARVKRDRRDSRGVVFIVDSLERLGASTFDFQETMESVVRVFTESPEFLRLPDCHVVYSIPPYVRLIRANLGNHYSRVSLVMPAVKVFRRDPEHVPYPPGVDALCSLVGRRIPAEHVFGERRDLLERLVTYSGGHVRTLLVFVREMLYDAFRQGFPVTEEDVEQAVQPFREQARIGIWSGTLGLLREIIQTGELDTLTREQYAYLAEYMDAYIVLCYRNGDGWYEVHPLVRDYVLKKAEEEESDE